MRHSEDSLGASARTPPQWRVLLGGSPGMGTKIKFFKLFQVLEKEFIFQKYKDFLAEKYIFLRKFRETVNILQEFRNSF